nr:immunoglobulin light chain junction region [Macaca mulatta]MOX52085.1 immunoglobulin light chain junction region [Macaca mulatta]MOX52300.1 immunoglobulin light chain junction region [Macaca mulatta]MOX52309.1 immunoglobulin light chain junction region [Macaca mulatta]MOX52573.1 immunoglobulin light chain junction region [Macaca mulatta]
CQKYNDSPWTF